MTFATVKTRAMQNALAEEDIESYLVRPDGPWDQSEWLYNRFVLSFYGVNLAGQALLITAAQCIEDKQELLDVIDDIAAKFTEYED